MPRVGWRLRCGGATGRKEVRGSRVPGRGVLSAASISGIVLRLSWFAAGVRPGRSSPVPEMRGLACREGALSPQPPHAPELSGVHPSLVQKGCRLPAGSHGLVTRVSHPPRADLNGVQPPSMRDGCLQYLTGLEAGETLVWNRRDWSCRVLRLLGSDSVKCVQNRLVNVELWQSLANSPSGAPRHLPRASRRGGRGSRQPSFPVYGEGGREADGWGRVEGIAPGERKCGRRSLSTSIRSIAPVAHAGSRRPAGCPASARLSRGRPRNRPRRMRPETPCETAMSGPAARASSSHDVEPGVRAS